MNFFNHTPINRAFLTAASFTVAALVCGCNTTSETSPLLPPAENGELSLAATSTTLETRSSTFIDTLSFNDEAANAHTLTIDVDEHKGVTLTNTLGKRLFIEGSFTVASVELVSDNQPVNSESSIKPNNAIVLLTAFNNNTQEITQLSVSPSLLSLISRVAHPVNGSEALCATPLSQQGTHLVNVDAQGMLQQFVIRHNSAIPLRHFAIGPGIKSCALSADAKTLYLADEFAGIWEIDADIESEISKTLVYHSNDYAIEDVSTVTRLHHTQQPSVLDDLVGWVSPDKSGLWLKNQCGMHVIDILGKDNSTPDGIKPEFLHLSLHGNNASEVLTITVDDDDSGDFFTASLPLSTFDQDCAEAVAETPEFASISVSADVETQPVEHFGDAADDPAIWVNIGEANSSLIIGTDKKGALNSYDLNGKQVQTLPLGRVNNVDVGYDVHMAPANSQHGFYNDIAVASNRTYNSLSVLRISKDGSLLHIGDIATSLNDIYGMCLYVTDGVAHVLANDTNGQFERYKLSFGNRDNVVGTLTDTFALPSQPEGCVVDTKNQVAYLGEEGAGIWTLDIGSNNSAPAFNTPIEAPVEADIEGLALFNVDGKQYLIASSQGNNAYAIYETGEINTVLSYIGLLHIETNFDNLIDGVSETDGLEASNANLGGIFSEGLWVVQDGRNVMPTETQNFKLVSGQQLKDAIRKLKQHNH